MQLFLMLLDSVQPLLDQVVGSLRRTPGPEYDVNIATQCCWLYRLTHLSNDNTFASMCIRHIAPISETMFCSQKFYSHLQISHASMENERKNAKNRSNWVTGRSGKEAKEGNSCWYGGGGSLKSPSEWRILGAN